jgi:hypothetical protein
MCNVSLIATDAKEFKRPKFERAPSGELARGENGRPIVADARGFYTQMGCTLVFEDPKKFETQFVDAFRQVAERFHVTLPRLFVSSKVLLEQVFDNNLSATLSFMYRLLELVQDQIGLAHICWVILPENRTPTVQVGGAKSVSIETPTREFLATVGNMFPPISAWHYFKHEGGRRLAEVRLDHFQGKTNWAWEELLAGVDQITVTPWGDECDPFICMADIFCYLSDKRLGEKHLHLRPENVSTVWQDVPFPVKGYFMDERFLSEVRWTNNKPLHLHKYYPSMTYLLIDDDLVADKTDLQDRVTFRAFLEGRGYVHAVVLNAQLKRGGFKVYHPDDWSEVRDGDHLVFMGPKSQEKAKGLSYAVRITMESVADLRNWLREKGYNC